MNLIHILRLLCLAVGFGGYLTAWAADSNIGETSSHEIQFCSGVQAPYASCAASDLRSKADALSSAPAIYEYVRNNYDFVLYHGARSGAINTFLGGQGNDVDLAATLISMLRSRGMPARFVVGTVRLPAAQAKNWLAVENTDLAYYLLRDQGIQGVVLAADKSTLDFEHVWVEALVPYAKYRGAGPTTVDCVATPASCNWVPLDPSFKQHKQRASGLDPHSVLSFDYTAYYNALKNDDASRRDKSPLEIYQEQVLAWLQANAPGKTLEDIPDFTGIVTVEDGLLPASLPFVTVGSLRRYNSTADHDAAVPGTESKKWMKYVTAQAKFGTNILGSATVNLIDAATKPFTFSYTQDSSATLTQVFRLGGSQVGSSVSAGATGQSTALGTAFSLAVTMDGAPAPDSNSTDYTISATYDAIIGGYYLIAAGGESANWSQVHRAAQQLLAANQQYKIVFNPGDPGSTSHPCDLSSGLYCTPYVDANNNGWDASDPKLVDNTAALDALTGGILYVAGSQYYAAFRDNIAKLDAINKVKSPLDGFLGVISATHEVEYIDGTAFSVTPGGLLIDMKGITFTGIWRIDQPAIFSNLHFDLLGHVASSLEHETWQKLTGYDAISTVRGVQLALSNGATLINPLKNATTDTVATMYPSLGYSNSAPSGFTRNVYSLFGQNYLSWSYSGADPSASFVAFRPNTQGLAAADPLLDCWTYAANSNPLFNCGTSITKGIDTYLNYMDADENALIVAKATEGQLKTNPPTTFTGDLFLNYDVLSASVSSPTGFSVGYSRTSSNGYQFTINETSTHVDGTYPVNISIDVGDAVNEQWTPGFTIPYKPDSYLCAVPTVSTAGFGIKNYGTGADGLFYIQLYETAAHANGTYTVNMSVKWCITYSNGVTAYFISAYSTTVTVINGRWVDGSIPLDPVSIDVSDNARLDCDNGSAITTYTGTPTTLLGNLQSCFNNYTQYYGLGSYFTFFDPAATLAFRSLPAANDAQFTSVVLKMRDDLYLNDQSMGWAEYLIPSKLSVGPNYRFSVDLRKHYNTIGVLDQWIFHIENETGISAGGGFVSPLQPMHLPHISGQETK